MFMSFSNAAVSGGHMEEALGLEGGTDERAPIINLRPSYPACLPLLGCIPIGIIFPFKCTTFDQAPYYSGQK